MTIAFVSCKEQLTSIINYPAGMMNKNEVNFPLLLFNPLEFFSKLRMKISEIFLNSMNHVLSFQLRSTTGLIEVREVAITIKSKLVFHLGVL